MDGEGWMIDEWKRWILEKISEGGQMNGKWQIRNYGCMKDNWVETPEGESELLQIKKVIKALFDLSLVCVKFGLFKLWDEL